jgi:DNA-directed RNA polymerase subunit RPC12/RpoP
MVVLVRCSNCGKEFPTMTVQIGNKQAMRSNGKNFSENCPHCGAPNTFGTQDLLWKDS